MRVTLLKGHFRAVKFFCLPALLCFTSSLMAQVPTTSDCLGATPVCNSSYDVPTLNPAPNNYPNEINAGNSCLNGETNGQWYTFTVQTAGQLGFNIIPYDPTSDYDWALFNLTDASCAEIYTNGALEVACNFSAQTTNNGITGANGQPGDENEAMLNVQAGQTFALYISNYNFGTNQSGYQLDFGPSSAQVPDNTAPSIESVSPNSDCGATQLTVSFSENIDCSSIQAGDFVLNGPGGPYSIASVSGVGCLTGGQYSRTFTLTLAQAINGSGAFSLDITGNISDVCGNNLAPGPGFDFDYTTLVLNLGSTDSDCPVDNGTATVNVVGGTPPYQYQWNDANGQTTATATGLPRGTYTVTVSDAQGCSVQGSVYVGDPTAFTIDVNQVPDTCQEGSGQLQVITLGPQAPFSYTWEDTIAGNSLWTGLVGDRVYKVLVTDANGCKRDTTVWLDNITNDTLKAFFTVDNEEVDVLTPNVNFFNDSEYESSIVWDFGDGQSPTDENLSYSFAAIGKFPVTLYAFDNNGCVDSYTRTIEVTYDFTFFAPDAFTPNGDNLNEFFRVTGIGMDPNKFTMIIYDRWGKEVFRTRSLAQGWDGSVDGAPPLESAQGVYNYKIEVTELDGTPRTLLGKVVMIK